MSENTNECVIEWIPGRDYVGLTAKNGSTWKNRCEELEKEFPDDVKILARNNDGSIFARFIQDKEVEEYEKPLTKEVTCFSCGRKVIANVSKYNGHISYHCQCGTNFIE